MVGDDGPVGQRQPAALAPADHGLDDVAEEPACRSAVSRFAAPLKVLPGDLEGILEELGERETVMSKKLTRTVRVPCHLRFADYWAEIEYRAKSADEGALPIFQGPAGGSVTQLYSSLISLFVTRNCSARCA